MKKYLMFFTFLMVAESLSAQIADSAKRNVALQGAVNFRDLGGYQTRDGRHVKWGKVYRSADISKLTDTDLEKLKSKHIDYDVDLRGHQESAQAPDRINPGTDYILCPAGSDSLNNWMKDAASHKMSGDSMILSFYSNTKYLADRYKLFFDKLLVLPDNESLVFHCTAGKDRTGIAAALFLYSLGVPYNTIVDDYTATNYYRHNENAKTVGMMVKMMHMDENDAKSMMAARKEYLDTAFDAIKRQYGSVDNFLKTQIGLDKQKQELLKRKFLE